MEGKRKSRESVNLKRVQGAAGAFEEGEGHIAEEQDESEKLEEARTSDDEEEENSEQEDEEKEENDNEDNSDKEEESDNKEEDDENSQDEEQEDEEEDVTETKNSKVLANYSEKLQKALIGDLDCDFPENVKLVRIFTSSTFTGKYF